ncbi:MAG: gliding motility-associated C-terminal domain-containing protein, partial [Prevotellaceae bacterium]|nr:gliding motility-associated C-terminal domain-containing protein [Prevotellaceae bacterium]
MKKSIITLIILCFCFNAKAQFLVNSTNAYLQIDDLPNIDAVFLFNGITPLTEISYEGFENVEWREYDNSFVANTAYFSPDNATGYILLIDGAPTYYIWVIDYSLYPVALNSLSVSDLQADICTTLMLNASVSAPDLVYFDKNNQRRTLTRSFTLHYVDYAFAETWQDSVVNHTETFPFTQITVAAPKQDVIFCLSGDNFAKQMNIRTDSICTDYIAVAVETHAKGTIEERPENNENNRKGGTEKDLNGSGPLNVYLESRANTPTANYFKWQIYNIENPQNYRNYYEENIHYTFQDYGSYVARLIVTSDGGCESVADSVEVQVEDYVDIQIPSAFSPNGDTANEEFRIAYKSINPNTYKCVIYNRWGRVVYRGNNPQKGWDGRVNGKMSATGAYYYFIEVTPVKKDPKTGKYKVEKFSGVVNL